jgi:hypothetical protein
MATAAEFQQSASDTNYTFDWSYLNSTEIANYNFGRNPVSASTMDTNLPIQAASRYSRQNWNAGIPLGFESCRAARTGRKSGPVVSP